MKDGVVDRSGFYRLRHADPHTFVFTPCPEAASRVRLQLLKLQVRPLRPTLTKVPQRRGFVSAVDVMVPASGTLVVRPTGDSLDHGDDDTFFTGVLPPTGRLHQTQGYETDALFFEAGRGLYLRHTTPYRYRYPTT